MSKIRVLVGTRKGAFILTSDGRHRAKVSKFFKSFQLSKDRMCTIINSI